MIKKSTIIGAFVCGLTLTSLPLTTFADGVSQKSSEPITHQVKPQPRTVIVAANGSLDGDLVPYIKGLDFTGKVTLHYTAQNEGFVDGDTSVLMIKLPEEFKYLGSTPDFAQAITGKVHVQTLLGDNEVDITPDMVETYTDRILIKTPHQLWIGQGHVQADIQIAYGQILAQYPTLPIDDAPGGYSFVAQLKYDAAMWDIIHDPILGTNDETYTTSETSAITH